ncbi:MAG TPA: M20 family metallopeptidase [Gammaproteobacteria bacterium]|nr:M20 family metallopeptidase [Gammaproteobacteria bacterium]
MNTAALEKFAGDLWQGDILRELTEYIRIPNKSPAFDPQWQEHGYMDAAVARFERWARGMNIRGMAMEAVRLPGRTPLLFMDIPGNDHRTVLLYGHLDKQPEMTGWREGLGPWQPVLEGDRLYGRGGADDGYAIFAALTAIKALQELNIPHARCVVIIEACEESGSFDLPYYIDALKARIGSPELVICLDSGCGNYEQLWVTTSLRGLVGGVLDVAMMSEGVHSGDAGGVVPNVFRVTRMLLSRIEDESDGRILDAAFNTLIPAHRIVQAQTAAQILGEETYRKFPLQPGVEPMAHQPMELILNRTWRPALAITGADGLPAVANAGNVALAGMHVKVSLRLPPNVDGARASATLKRLLEEDPPHGARVTFTPDWAVTGWNAPHEAEWLTQSLDRASRQFFGKAPVYMGEGGTIPFMAMLGERYPRAQFVITGVLGPHANAHGPNEFLHLPTAHRVTCCVAQVIADHYSTGEKT